MDEELLIRKALECGAGKAVVIPRDAIVLNVEFRAMCEANRCGAYGKCYMCPPDVGGAQELMDRVRGYEKGLWYQAVTPLEDSFDIEGMGRAKKEFVKISQRLRDALDPILGESAFHLSGGGCGLCDTCAKVTGEPCRFPGRAMPSLESCCIDVYNTTKNTPLKYINGPDTVTYFGMVLFSEAADG